jgi:hypothetical protein
MAVEKQFILMTLFHYHKLRFIFPLRVELCAEFVVVSQTPKILITTKQINEFHVLTALGYIGTKQLLTAVAVRPENDDGKAE